MSTVPALFSLWFLALPGCKDKSDPVDTPRETGGDDTADPETGAPVETACAEAEARLGFPACEHRVPDEETFEAITIAATTVDQLRVGKYIVPARSDARIPPAFLVVGTYPLHYDFLVEAFPDLFSGLTTADYESLVLYPESREFYAGTLALYLSGDRFYYGFTVWDDPSDSTSTVTEEDVTEAWEILQDRFDIGDLSFVPNSAAQVQAASSWADAPFTIEGLDSDVVYEAYNQGEAYGTLRLYTLEELEAATVEADFGYQDILVIEEAPVDLERVVSGIVTGTRQGGLSHLSVRSAARGTPNCFVADPHGELAAWEGQLVRFECGADDWSVEAASTEDAEAWWASIQPDPVELCPPVLDELSFPGLLELATSTAEDRAQATCTYGSKGTNLATLYQLIDEEYQLTGFLIPFYYYQEFMDTHGWLVDLGAGEAEYTFTETLDAWHADPLFLADPTERRARLGDLRDAIEDAEVDPALVAALAERIEEVWGSDEIMVRFRSSSNAEDSLGFSGAGLYESESVCVADELDGDESGPCICDDRKDEEQTLQAALLEVWASLWKMEAWDERDWYGMDQSQVAMGVLVNTRSGYEQANVVAFTGNPAADDDDRYLINAQEGELEVVSAESGVVPENVLVTVEDGVVTEILRVSGSSEVDGGEVLTDAELSELAAVLYETSLVFPQDEEVPEGRDVLWDTEWKVDSEGQLKLKQIRPYLR